MRKVHDRLLSMTLGLPLVRSDLMDAGPRALSGWAPRRSGVDSDAQAESGLAVGPPAIGTLAGRKSRRRSIPGRGA